MRPHDELSNVPKNIRKNSAALKRRAGFFLAAAFSIALMSTATRAQVPILYYDFENNATRTVFENLVEQAVNSGSGAITRAGNTTTISDVGGAGTFNGGATTGQAATGSNWDSSTADPGSAATNYYQFVVNTGGFSQILITFDNQASGTGPARVGALYSTDGTNFTATTTILTGNAVFSAATFDLSSISAIDNQSSVTIRLYAFAGSAGDRASRSAFASTGTFRIDNLTVLAKTVTASKTLLDYPAIGLSIKSSTAFTPTYIDFIVNGAGIVVVLASELKVSGAFTVSNGTLNCGTNVVSGTGTFALAPGGTLGIGSTAGITSSGATGNIQTATRNFDTGANYNYNGSAAQVTGNGLPTTVNDLAINNTAGVSLSSAVNVSSALALTSGTFSVGAHTLTLNNPIAGTPNNLSADSTSSITIAGSSSGINIPSSVSALNNLTLNNSSGTTLQGNLTVSGVLALTSGDITTGLFTIFMGNGATSDPASTGDVVGNVNRSDLGSMGARSFGNPNVQITITAGTVTAMTVNLIKASPSDFGNALRRTYTLKDVVGTLGTATVRLHYLDSELNGNAEGTLDLWRKDGSNWVSQGATTRDSTDNWVEKTLITSFSPWTIAGPTGPTYVAMVGYAANRLGNGKVLIDWETGYEVDNLGFNIYRQESGERVRVNKSMIAGSALFAGPGTRLTAGRSYIWRDKLPEGSDARYWLEEIELNGRSIWHGPIFAGDNPPPKAKYLLAANDVSDAKTIEDMNTESAEQAPTLPVEEMAHLQMVGNNGLMKADAVGVAAATWTLGSESAVKLSVKREGWYRVTAAELQAAGLAADAAPKRLQLFVDGQEIPMKVVAGGNNKLSAIEFYGIGIDTPSTDSHIYWVTVGPQKGKRIETASGNGSAAPANSFPYSVERRDRSIYLSGIRNGDEENFFGAVVLSSPVNQVVNLPRVDTAAAGQATIEIAMQGLSLLSHHVSVSLNGNHLGAIDFNAQASKSATFTVPMSSLLEGPNTFTVQGQSTVLDVTLVDRIRVTYLRTYTADSNLLKLTAAGEQKVTVGGFTGAGVRVMDVTNPANVSEVQLTPAPGNASTDSVTFSVPGVGNRSLLVFAGDQVRAVAGAVANNKSNLRNNSPKADLVIITHGSLVNSFTPLAALRQAQGLKVAMVDIEDVYDEFSYGNKAPQSVKDFLSFTKSNWRRAPKYVLLAGGASYDPKNYEGQGANDLVPAKLVDTEFMETASDDWFSDFNNDALAEMAMGRLPANNAAEADAMVAKIIGYETSTRSNSVALTSDQNDDFSFEGASDQLKPLVPGTIAKVEIDRGQLGTTVAKQQLLSAIAAGQKIVNYTGHGSSTQWRSSFLTSDDARALTNGSRLPLFVMMTCLNGLFQDANLDGLAPALMKSAKGGAVAVWASSGLTEPAEQSVLNQQLYKLLFPTAGTALNLGDATMKAKSAVTDPDIRRTWILFGDPTTRLK